MLDNFHKKDCNKELCKKSFKNKLCGIPRTRIKRIISAFKDLQIRVLLSSKAE